MQYACENLEHTILHGKVEQVITTVDDDAADDLISKKRAESHTRPQLEALISQLRAQRAACVNAKVKESFSHALAPLEARLKRYHDAEKRIRDKAARERLRREEIEFKEMIASWLRGIDEDALEQGFLGVCMWQVENSHRRDLARDKWRMRAEHRALAQRHKTLPTTALRFLGKHAYSAFSAQRTRPRIPLELSPAEFQKRVDALADEFWDLQGDVDVDLCDAYGCDAFDDLPEAAKILDLGFVFEGGRDLTQKVPYGLSPPEREEGSDDEECSEEEGDDVLGPLRGRPAGGGGGGKEALSEDGLESARSDDSSMSSTSTSSSGSEYTSGSESSRSSASSGSSSSSGSSGSESSRSSTGNASAAAEVGAQSKHSSAAAAVGGGANGDDGKPATPVQQRPWTPTPPGTRDELWEARKLLLETLLLRKNSVKDLVKEPRCRRRVEALIEKLLYKMAEFDEQGSTLSSHGQGGDGIAILEARPSGGLLGAAVHALRKSAKVSP